MAERNNKYCIDSENGSDYTVKKEILEVSDSNEEVSESENFTNFECESDSSDSSDSDNVPLAFLFNSGTVLERNCVLSKDKKIEWKLEPPQQKKGRLPSFAIMKKAPGVTRYAISRVSDIKSSFEIIFNSAIENHIIAMTNIEGQRIYSEKWQNIDSKTIQAYFGLLILAGVYKSHGESTKSLWDKETGRSIFRSTMSKPKMILDYNATKGAVDTLDQLVSSYTCKRKTNRWPVIVFYNMLDISAYNAYVIWTSINPQWNENKLYKRRLFLEELGKSLIHSYIISRTHKPRTDESLIVINKLKTAESTVSRGLSENIETVKRARCKFCPAKNDNKTRILCSKCRKYICKSHTTYYCPSCLPQ